MVGTSWNYNRYSGVPYLLYPQVRTLAGTVRRSLLWSPTQYRTLVVGAARTSPGVFEIEAFCSPTRVYCCSRTTM